MTAILKPHKLDSAYEVDGLLYKTKEEADYAAVRIAKDNIRWAFFILGAFFGFAFGMMFGTF